MNPQLVQILLNVISSNPQLLEQLLTGLLQLLVTEIEKAVAAGKPADPKVAH